MDAVIQYFIERWPYFTIAVLVLTGAIWLTIKLTKRAVRTDYLEEKSKSMPCEEHHTKIVTHDGAIERLEKRTDRLETKMDKLIEEVGDIKTSIVSIETFLQSKYKTASPLFSQKYSPRTLNAKGKEVYAQFGGADFLQENGEMLCKRIEAKKPKTALDVEREAQTVLYETMDLDIFNNVKLKVYNSKDIVVNIDGKEESYSITMGDICFIFSLELRDLYLAKHAEVPQGESE